MSGYLPSLLATHLLQADSGSLRRTRHTFLLPLHLSQGVIAIIPSSPSIRLCLAWANSVFVLAFLTSTVGSTVALVPETMGAGDGGGKEKDRSGGSSMRYGLPGSGL